MKAARLLVFTALLGACDPLVETGFQGKPLFTAVGEIEDFRLNGELPPPLIATLFWSTTGNTTLDPAFLRHQESTSVQQSFPSSFLINVFEPPGAETRDKTPYSVGELLVWEDVDGNGEYSLDENRGGAMVHAILYTETELAAELSPTGSVLAPGFALVQLPQPCEVIDPIPDGNDCDVPLGAPCQADEQCGQGECLVGLLEFPDGYCVLPAASTCVPADGIEHDVYTETDDNRFWLLACASNEACREGYACDALFGTCLGKQGLAILINEDSEEPFISPLCPEYSEARGPVRTHPIPAKP